MSRQFLPIAGLTQAAVVLQAIVAVLNVVMLGIQLSLRDEARAFLDGAITRKDFDDAIGGNGTLSLLTVALNIALIVVLIVWTYRLATNLRRYGREPLTWKPLMGILVWILGGCTLGIITYLMLREHWRGSDPEVPAGSNSWRTGPVDRLIVVWFTLTVTGVVLSIVLLGASNIFSGVDLSDSSTTFARQLSDHAAGTALSTLVGTAASIVLILVLRAIGARHMRLTHER